jgi:hypothetical protein
MRENSLKRRLVKNFVEFIKTIKCRNEYYEIVGIGRSKETDASNWSTLATTDVKDLEKV